MSQDIHDRPFGALEDVSAGDERDGDGRGGDGMERVGRLAASEQAPAESLDDGLHRVEPVEQPPRRRHIALG